MTGRVYKYRDSITLSANTQSVETTSFFTTNTAFVNVMLNRSNADRLLVEGTDYTIEKVSNDIQSAVMITAIGGPFLSGDTLTFILNKSAKTTLSFTSENVRGITPSTVQDNNEGTLETMAAVLGVADDSAKEGDATTLKAAETYADGQDAIHSAADRQFTEDEITRQLAGIREKDREQDEKINAAGTSLVSGQVLTAQKTFYHDPNRIGGNEGQAMYEIIDILKGSDANAKLLYTERQAGSFVSANDFMPLTTEDFTVGNETHEALVASFPGNILEYTYLAVGFNDSDVQLQKSELIPIKTIANGFDWILSDARAQENDFKRELRVRIAYDETENISKVKFHKERVPGSRDASTAVYLFTAYLIKETAKALLTDNNAFKHFIRVVRKEGSDFGDRDYYVENIAEVVQEDEFYIVNPGGGGDIPAANNGYFAIKNSDGVITYTVPKNGDTAIIYADRQVDIRDTDGSVSHANENKIAAILIYEGGRWVITNSYFKTANECIETGAFANAEGNRNEATGDYSHAEGWNSDATGLVAHAEGSATLASGRVSHAQGQGTVAKTDFSSISGRYGVLGDPDTLVGIAWGRFAPNTSDETASVDKDLIWKINKDGDTTQDGTVTAEDFVKADGSAITDLSGYYTKAESDTNDIAILEAAEASDVSKSTDLTDMPQTLGTANAGKILEVNAAGDGYELIDKLSGSGSGSGSSTFTGLTDTPISYTGQAGKYLQVNRGENSLEFTDKPSGGSDAPAHFVRTVRKEGTSVSDKDYYVENVAEIVQTDEFYIVNPVVAQLGTIADAEAGKFAIKASNGTITYSAPSNGDTAMVYADRQVDITDGDGNVLSSDENRLVAVLIYEGQWIITNSYFKNGNNITETGAWANAEGGQTTASGDQSHAEGRLTTASGINSHAEGRQTTASDAQSHAEGRETTASGENSHAEGMDTTASGRQSHAEGTDTTASGENSHAEGNLNTVKNDYAHIQGRRGVLAHPDTIHGIAYGDHNPTTNEKAGAVDVGLVYKVDKTGNSTQTGKVKAASFEKTDGTVVEPITLPNPGRNNGDRDLVSVVRNSSGDLVLTDGTSTDVSGLLDSLSTSAPNSQRFGGHAIKTGTIPEDRLAASVVTKLNAEDGGANKAIEALASDMEWETEVQTYNNASVPTSPATIGLGYRIFAAGASNESHRIDFIFPTATSKADIDALVLNRKFVIEVPEGVITLEPTSHVATAVVSGGFHRERYDGDITPSFSDFTNTSDGNNDYQTTLYRGLESGVIADGSITTPKIAGAAVTEVKLSADVISKLNASASAFSGHGIVLTSLGTPALLTSATPQAITFRLPAGKNIRDYDRILFRMTSSGIKGEYFARGLEIDSSTSTAQIVLAGLSNVAELKIYSPTTNAITITNVGSFTPNILAEIIAVDFTGEKGDAGSSTFTGLTDTPAALTGQAGKYLQVNTGESALEFADAPSGGGGFSSYRTIFTAKSATANNVLFIDPAYNLDSARTITFTYNSPELSSNTIRRRLVIGVRQTDWQKTDKVLVYNDDQSGTADSTNYHGDYLPVYRQDIDSGGDATIAVYRRSSNTARLRLWLEKNVDQNGNSSSFLHRIILQADYIGTGDRSGLQPDYTIMAVRLEYVPS